jgi:hypothetical protein
LQVWLAAGLSTLAIAVLNRRPVGAHHDIGLTVIGALLASVAFALFDVLVMAWSPAWGAGRFLPLVTGLTALFSVMLVPLFEAPLRQVPRLLWPLLLGGGAFIALQGILLITALAVFGDATAINIVYSTRGVWSVLLIWLAGGWLGSDEAVLGSAVLRWRLAGAGIMMLAVVALFV